MAKTHAAESQVQTAGTLNAIPTVTMQDVQLYNADCSHVLPALPDGSIDCILADPPYGIAYEAKQHEMLANDEAPFVWWLGQAHRLLANKGVLVCWCRWDVAEAFRNAIGWAGLSISGQLVWDRVLHGQGDCSRTPAPQHDLAWVATKGKWSFPASRGKSVVRYLRERGGFGECSKGLLHPTMKPVSLMEELVLVYSTPGQTVLDPTMGSGTTGVAAVKHGRKFVGIEMDSKYFATCEKRIRAASGQVSMFKGMQDASATQQLSLLEDIKAGHAVGEEQKGDGDGGEEDGGVSPGSGRENAGE